MEIMATLGFIFASLFHALWTAFGMLWQLFWGLSIGFLLSAMIENLVSRHRISALLPDASLRSIAIATALGAASSSCSYAAVAMARSAIRKGANFTAAMAFQFAATNVVLELAILMGVMIGWAFAAAEAMGGVVMIALITVMFRLLKPSQLEKTAVKQAKLDSVGKMEGHAEMSMAEQPGQWRTKLLSRDGWIAISHSYIMTWAMLWRDVGVGLLVAGALSAWVPAQYWQKFFIEGHPLASALWGAIVGPLIALASFTCSVGNIPLAGVLWHGGISFGGVASFIFGDLIILPIINIYRKYYGLRMTAFMCVCFYIAMVLAALCVEGVFAAAGLLPEHPAHSFINAMPALKITLNYTSVLDMMLGAVSIALLVVFLRSGGLKMMRMMKNDDHGHSQSCHP